MFTRLRARWARAREDLHEPLNIPDWPEDEPTMVLTPVPAADDGEERLRAELADAHTRVDQLEREVAKLRREVEATARRVREQKTPARQVTVPSTPARASHEDLLARIDQLQKDNAVLRSEGPQALYLLERDRANALAERLAHYEDRRWRRG